MTYADAVKAIIKRMKEIHVTRAGLARALGVSQKTVQNWLTYKTPIPGDRMIYIFKLLWIDLEIVWRGK